MANSETVSFAFGVSSVGGVGGVGGGEGGVGLRAGSTRSCGRPSNNVCYVSNVGERKPSLLSYHREPVCRNVSNSVSENYLDPCRST